MPTVNISEVLMSSKNLGHNNLQLIRHNASLVKKLYPKINRTRIQALKDLTKQFSFSFAGGDVILLENGWFVTHTGLVRLARRKRCRGIHVEAVDSLCDSAVSRYVLKATVYPSKEYAAKPYGQPLRVCGRYLVLFGKERFYSRTKRGCLHRFDERPDAADHAQPAR